LADVCGDRDQRRRVEYAEGNTCARSFDDRGVELEGHFRRESAPHVGAQHRRVSEEFRRRDAKRNQFVAGEGESPKFWQRGRNRVAFAPPIGRRATQAGHRTSDAVVWLTQPNSSVDRAFLMRYLLQLGKRDATTARG